MKRLISIAILLFTLGCNGGAGPDPADIPANKDSSVQNLFLDSQHSGSHRFAIFEDDGTSAWLYITEPNSQKPSGDAWVYNRIAAPPTEDVKLYRGGPPPATIGYASDTALCQSPHSHEWLIKWATDGESVAIIKDGVPVACIIGNPQASYSRELTKDGPWGRAWSTSEFDRVF